MVSGDRMQCQQLPSRYFSNGDPVFVRRAETGPYMPLSQNYPLDHYDSSSQSSRRATPSSDADKPGAGGRKRVPVACERCRKRKIKCSGDEGGSCSNCRNAGAASSCQFLRVNSMDTNVLVRLRDRGTSWQGSHRYSPYPSPYRSHHGNLQSTYPHYNQHAYSSQALQNGVDYGYPIASHSSSWSRAGPYASPYSPYDEQSPTYVSQSGPSFLLPNSDPMGAGNTYPVNPYIKTHASQLLQEQQTQLSGSPPVSQLITAPYNVSPYDQAVSYPTVAHGPSATLRSDRTSAYHTIGMPHPATLASERVLPNPSRQYSTSQVSTLDSLPMSAGTLSHRSSIGWTTDASSSSSHVSSQTSCSSAGGCTDSSAGKYHGHRDSQDLGYSYYAANNSPVTLPNTTLPASASEVSVTKSNLMPTISELDQQPRCRTVSQENLQESPDPAASYGYTGSTVARSAQSRSTSGRLISGPIYTRIGAQSSLHHPGSDTEDCDANCPDCPTNPNRASITSISNLASY